MVALCLILLAGCAAGDARLAGYQELAAWLEINALPDETVAAQETSAWSRLTDLPVAALPEGGDARALLASLQETRPDYCVALRSLAWDGVQAAPWFRERYHQVAAAMAMGDSTSPLILYRYHPSPFDAGERLALNHTLHEDAVGHITVEAVRRSSPRLEPGAPVYISVTMGGDVREPLRAEWRLRDAASGQVWRRDVRLEPGGLPTDAWPVHGTVTARYIVMPPDDAPPGEYALELAFERPNLAPFDEPLRLATLSHPPDVTRDPPAPDHALDITAGEAITLAGYDAPQRLAPGETLRVALYWRARREVAGDFKVFVHVFGPEGTLVAQSDAAPVNWSYPTTAWQPGDYVRDVHIIPLEATLPRGDYRVLAGMYDPTTGARLPLRDAQGTPLVDNAAELYTLRVR